ncbi:type III-B CRISPR-associated protein Cas10/Cmr2 [Rhodoferax sp.]|uniref:type III-B CRISPR-associated protein Cas10/Cmr2 n=1 Tax=Rhodoferax sp. TaxID=50421 RepID=UPI0026108EB2|nr:type III-B CRISPR-associated protein Cas10/Cmr2 [Rhodoferax sp.]MDD2919544.1 type III-B CRISPR-associated protein Cas10/Cmr2 [Rhodoferax sp.]
MTHILHFTISPVQTFIGQSRRTRDLWSSSFLLSWLSGVAMAQVHKSGGRILFPSVLDGDAITDDLLRAILGNADKAPFIGTLPNRFKAEVAADFDPSKCSDAVHTKWGELATLVRQRFLPLTALKDKNLIFVPSKKQKNPNAQNKTLTESLWDQQVANFWDVQWVKGVAPADGGDARWLDRRKNWRQHIQPDQQEPGDACSLMPGSVELSGHIRSRSQELRKKQDDFWAAVRDHVPGVHHGQGPRNPGPGRLNLRDDERLCAVAFVKRLWPKLHPDDIKEVLGWVPDRITQSAGNWPSTAYMAALPWIKKVYAEADPARRARCDAYVDALNAARVHPSAAKTQEGLFSETLNQIEGIEARPYFCTLDGQLFYEDGLQAAAKEGLLAPNSVLPLQKQLAKIDPDGKPSPFYAVLRMDGDNVGKLIGREAGAVSRALSDFAGKVQRIVDTEHHGAALYAGGDDVLALLPLDDAIGCAQALRHAYQEAMHRQQLDGTISAGIVFAHYHLPLSFVMAESSRLLDDIAKTENGRNSVAVTVHKPGGQHLQWVACWDAAVDQLAPLATVLDLAGKFRTGQDAAKRDVPLSSGFLYRIRERWGDLAPRDLQGQRELGIPQQEVEQLWAADLLSNRDLGEVNDDSRATALALASQLFAISRDNRATTPAPPTLLAEDGGLLVRFLATKGVQR